MINFARTYVDTVKVHPGESTISDCYMYEIALEDQHAGKLYFGINCSFIQAGNKVLRIDYIDRFLRPDEYHLTDHISGAYAGHYDIKHTRASLYLGETAFSFSRNLSHRRILNPSSWSLHRYDLINDDVEIAYFYRDQASGRIECSREGYLTEILAGLFIIAIFEKRASDQG